jgi:hypothetical protein
MSSAEARPPVSISSDCVVPLMLSDRWRTVWTRAGGCQVAVKLRAGAHVSSAGRRRRLDQPVFFRPQTTLWGVRDLTTQRQRGSGRSTTKRPKDLCRFGRRSAGGLGPAQRASQLIDCVAQKVGHDVAVRVHRQANLRVAQELHQRPSAADAPLRSSAMSTAKGGPIGR